MKKIISITKFIVILFIIVLIAYKCSGSNYVIKTEYGDIFRANCDFLSETAEISCLEHNFDISVKFIGSEDDLKPICDTDFFRCYQLKNEYEDFFICGLKPNGNYLWINNNDKNVPNWFVNEYSEDFRKMFLSDEYIMEISLLYMDSIFHYELVDMYNKLSDGEYESLKEYGFTKEMSGDTDSINNRINILKKII